MPKTRHYKNNKRINKTTKKKKTKRKIKRSNKTKNSKAKGSTSYLESKASHFSQTKEEKIKDRIRELNKKKQELRDEMKELRQKMDNYDHKVTFVASENAENIRGFQILRNEYHDKEQELRSLIESLPSIKEFYSRL